MAVIDELNEIARKMGKPDLVAEREGLATEIRGAYEKFPEARAEARSRIFDSPALKQYEQYEQQVAKQLFTEPTTYLSKMNDASSPDYVHDPMARLKYASQKQGTIISKLLGIKRQIERKEGDLQDILNAWIEEYEYNLASKKYKQQELDDAFNLAKDIWGMQEQRKLASRGTPAERAIDDARQAAIADARGGMVARDLAIKYTNQVPAYELINIYNANSPYGAMKETPEEFMGFGGEGALNLNDPVVQAYADKIASGEAKLSNVPADRRDAVVVALKDRPFGSDEKKSYDVIMKGIGELRKTIEPGKILGIIPRTRVKAQVDTKRKLLAMQVARLYEKGRITDKDREYYLSLLPTGESAATTPWFAKQQLDTLETMMRVQFGGETPEAEAPTEGSFKVGRFDVVVE